MIALQLVLGALESENLIKREVPGTGNPVFQGGLKLRFSPDAELGKRSVSQRDENLVELLHWDTFPLDLKHAWGRTAEVGDWLKIRKLAVYFGISN